MLTKLPNMDSFLLVFRFFHNLPRDVLLLLLKLISLILVNIIILKFSSMMQKNLFYQIFKITLFRLCKKYTE